MKTSFVWACVEDDICSDVAFDSRDEALAFDGQEREDNLYRFTWDGDTIESADNFKDVSPVWIDKIRTGCGHCCTVFCELVQGWFVSAEEFYYVSRGLESWVNDKGNMDDSMRLVDLPEPFDIQPFIEHGEGVVENKSIQDKIQYLATIG